MKLPLRMCSYEVLTVTYVLLVPFSTTKLCAETIFQTSTPGNSGISTDNGFPQNIQGFNIEPSIFIGARFSVDSSYRVDTISSHLVGFVDESAVFGVIVALDSLADFPDSPDFSTPDVLGYALLQLDTESTFASSTLDSLLTPGHYAIVLGSGLFGAVGNAIAVANGQGIGQPSFIARQSGVSGPPPNIDWFDLQADGIENSFISITGQAVPEPNCWHLMLTCITFRFLILGRKRVDVTSTLKGILIRAYLKTV